MNIKQGDQLLLKFDNDKVHLNDTTVIDKSKVDIGQTRTINSGVKWKISVIKYIPEEKRIFAKVIDYQSNENGFSTLQTEVIDKHEVEKINFNKIDTGGLLNSSSPNKKIFSTSIETLPEIGKESSDILNEEEQKSNEFNTYKENNERLTKEINVSFSFPVKRISFFNGYIEFTKYIQETNREVKFIIQNTNIKEEFDSIKNYFESYLKRKDITVNAKIIFSNREIIECEATSNEIAKIGESAIESVKFNFINRTFIKSRTDEESGKNIFTLDELYNDLTEGKTKARTFHSSPQELVDDLINIKSSKHYKQLRYLSSKHLSNILNLRFILKPFSFVFLLENKETYFIIWETLNTSEATYVWIVNPKGTNKLRSKLTEIDNVIGNIKEGGKRLYLKDKPEGLKRINHNYTNAMTGTKQWIEELENLLNS